MASLPLSLAELSKAQAEAEGFQNGPAPTLNPANLYVQDCLAGNPQTPGTPASTTSYYPSAETPNLQLSTEDMSAQLANNFVILDSIFPTTMQMVTINISAAQLATFGTAPVQVLPAPGAGKMYVVFFALCNLIFGGIAYNNLSAVELFLGSTYGTNLQISGINLDGAVNNIVVRAAAGQNSATSTGISQPLSIGSTIPNPTLGNGNVVLTVWYTTVLAS